MIEAETKLETILLDPWDNGWFALTSAHPQAHIFHHPAWISLLADCYGYRPFVIALRDEKGEICAGLPMMELGSLLTGRHWKSLPFTDHCAPLYYTAEEQSSLITSLVKLSKDHGPHKIELRCEFPPHPAVRPYTLQVLHTLPLCPDCETIADRFNSNHRRNIKVAVNRGVRVEWGVKREHVKAFYRLHVQTRRRQGIPVQPWRFFDLFTHDLIEKGLGFVLLAYKDNDCLAAAIFLHWQGTLTYKFGASSLDGLNLRPNNLLFWTAIQWGCQNGYAIFDMGKTDLANTGLRKFKSNWGCEEQLLQYSILTDHPPKVASTRNAHHLLIPLIQHSPAWFCRALGELFYRHFG